MPVLILALALYQSACAIIASPWPGGAEQSIPISDASEDLSGATWNPMSKSLWVTRQDRQAWEFMWNESTQSFELLQTLTLPTGIGSDIEACAQVDHAATDTLFTLAENQGRIARVVGIGTSPAVERVWNLEVTNNGFALPPETGGAGAEGLEFVPDADLLAASFRFPDGSAFAGSVKGMGGLMFVGHQIDGRLHVFDLNPDVSNDFINHGSFLTSADEIAGLHYDRSNARMLIWHNPGSVNSLEITSLSSDDAIGTIDTLELYDSAMPAGNLEGIALVDEASCGEYGAAPNERVLFLTRDGGDPNLVYFDEFPCKCQGADLNSDGVVDTADLGILLGQFGLAGPDGDLNGDGVVDTADLGILLGAFGMSCS